MYSIIMVQEAFGRRPAMKNHNGSVIILFISPFRDNIQERSYKCDFLGEEQEIKGTQTNDAPVLSLLKYANERNDSIKKLVCICSSKVKEEKENGKIKAIKNLGDFLSSKGFSDIEIKNVDYDEEENSVDKRMSQTFGNLAKELNNLSGNVYIDFTGGFRDTSLLMLTTVRYLGFMGIECEKVVYSNINVRSQRIDDITQTYKMFDIISAVDEFTTNARVTKLKEIFKNNSAIKSIEAFSKKMLICDMRDIDTSFIQMKKSIEEMGGENDFQELLLRYLKDKVVEKMGFDKILPGSNDVSEAPGVDYCEMISWCLENDMIQQAITLYVEKLPEMYEKYLDADYIGKLKDETVNADKTSGELFYLYFTKFRKTAVDNERNRLKVLQEECKKEMEKDDIDIIDIEHIKTLIKPYTEKGNGFFDELIRLLNEYYEPNCNEGNQRYKKKKDRNPPNFGEKELVLVNNPDISGTNRGIIVHILNNDPIIYYLAGKTIDDYNRDHYDNLYKQRLIQIENAEKGHAKEEQIMKYYFAAKIYRNKINHASENELNDVEEECLKRLSQWGVINSGYDHDEETIDIVKSFLLEGVKRSKDFIKDR